MTDFDKLWPVERRFWLDGPDFYAKRMMAEARMIFPPPTGILAGAEVLDALRQAPRWRSVAFGETSQAKAGETVVLAYRAEAERAGSPPYVAYCSSAYVRDGGVWKLLSHQQTPAAARRRLT